MASCRKQMFERARSQIGHDEIGQTILLTIIIDLQDIGVVQAGDYLGLTGETAQEGAGVFLILLWLEDFDSDFALEMDVSGKEDRGHSSLLNWTDDVVVSQRLIDQMLYHSGCSPSMCS